MWAYLKKSIICNEYPSPTGSKGKINLTKPLRQHTLQVSPLRLAAATGRTILTRHPLLPDLVIEAATAYLNIFTSIDGVATDFRLVQGFRKKYRDFSLTSRIGELAQGIGYLVSQDILGYSTVIDFESYVEDCQGIIHAKGEKPDFVLESNHAGHRALLEVKGGVGRVWTQAKLRKGLEQCQSGVTTLNSGTPSIAVQNKYAMVCRLEESDSSRPTTVSYCDPANDSDNNTHIPIDVYRRYYAAWFSAWGQMSAASYIFNGQKLEGVGLVEINTAEGKYVAFDRYYPGFVPSVRYLYDFLGGLYPKRLRFCLRKDVYEALFLKEPSELFSSLEKISDGYQKKYEEPFLEKFRDGTAIIGGGTWDRRAG